MAHGFNNITEMKFTCSFPYSGDTLRLYDQTFGSILNSSKIKKNFYQLLSDDILTIKETIDSPVDMSCVFLLDDCEILVADFTYVPNNIHFIIDCGLVKSYIRYCSENRIVYFSAYDNSYFYCISESMFVDMDNAIIQKKIVKIDTFIGTLTRKAFDKILEKRICIPEYKIEQIKNIIKIKQGLMKNVYSI